jgi:outer membrane protein assembly factor BamB
MKKILFCFLLFFNININLSSQDIRTLIKEPKLLWQKEFNTYINSVAISSDGAKIAVTLNLNIKKGKRNGGKLLYINNKGNIIWEYDPNKEKGDVNSIIGLNEPHKIVMSDDGEYIACSLTEYIENEDVAYDMKTHTKKIEKFVTWQYSRILFLNSKGTLLWSFKANGIPTISSNGSYILICPDADENGIPLDNFYFLDKTGRKLWEQPGFKTYLIFEKKMSKDGKYIAIGNKIYDDQKNVILNLSEFLNFPNVCVSWISDDAFIAIVEGYPAEDTSFGWIKLFCIDLKNKKILWKKEAREEQPTPPYKAVIYLHPFKNYYISRDNNYIITFEEEGVGIYDLISGELINKPWKMKARYMGEIKINDKNYLIGAKNEKELYFFELFTGSSQKMLELPNLQSWGQIKISENNKYMLIEIKNNLYLYEIR